MNQLTTTPKQNCFQNNRRVINPKIQRFLVNESPATPCLVVDLDAIAENYLTLRRLMPQAQIYYAMKANPAPEILQLLVGLEAKFDTASIYEIEQCIAAGAAPADISYGNTIKKAKDIASAYKLGIRLFAFDSLGELEKIATYAPGSKVYCRLLMNNEGAEWPLSRKFGCEIDMAYDLLVQSHKLNLIPYGVSFHVGSQQTDPTQWDKPICQTAMLFSALKQVGIELQMINLGGGFPGSYQSEILDVKNYTNAIAKSMHSYFGNNLPEMMLEPGRSLVADAGVIQSEVVLISQKSHIENKRWVFIDIGKFGGLAETMDECIKYRICTPKDGAKTGLIILAGPTCDSADILYEKADYELPLNLQVGDKIEILSTGAYTSSYCSVGFNGFPILTSYYI